MPNELPPTFAHWPATLVSASILSGTLVRCGPGVRAPGWPDTRYARSAAIAHAIGSRYAAVERTAAWIWGVCDSPGSPLTASKRLGRVSMQDMDYVMRKQLRFEKGDLTRIGPTWVTTPNRTAYDLLRSSETFTADCEAQVRALLGERTDDVLSLMWRARSSSKIDQFRVSARLAELYKLNW